MAQEFLQHATDERGHADMVAARIVQLQGDPAFNPATLVQRSHAEYHQGTDLIEMIQEDLVDERVAIASYDEIIRWLDNKDPTTRRMIETILDVEEEHADDLLSMLKEMDIAEPKAEATQAAAAQLARPRATAKTGQPVKTGKRAK